MKRGSKKTRLHFMANTHLDREWTVNFLDRLIEMMKEVPEYRFLMDSQAVPLED